MTPRSTARDAARGGPAATCDKRPEPRRILRRLSGDWGTPTWGQVTRMQPGTAQRRTAYSIRALGSTRSAYAGVCTGAGPVSYTHLRAHETPEHLVCRLLLEKKKK